MMRFFLQGNGQELWLDVPIWGNKPKEDRRQGTWKQEVLGSQKDEISILALSLPAV